VRLVNVFVVAMAATCVIMAETQLSSAQAGDASPKLKPGSMSTRWIEMNILARDFEYAVRMLAKSPGFALAAILSLAIGIGANTSIFGIINALLLRPLQYQDADRVVILWNHSPGLNIAEDWFSTAQYFDIKTGHHGFEQVAIAIGGNYNLTSRGGTGTGGHDSCLLQSLAHARPSSGFGPGLCS
jgi:hypothetical protein